MRGSPVGRFYMHRVIWVGSGFVVVVLLVSAFYDEFIRTPLPRRVLFSCQTSAISVGISASRWDLADCSCARGAARRGGPLVPMDHPPAEVPNKKDTDVDTRQACTKAAMSDASLQLVPKHEWVCEQYRKTVRPGSHTAGVAGRLWSEVAVASLKHMRLPDENGGKDRRATFETVMSIDARYAGVWPCGWVR